MHIMVAAITSHKLKIDKKHNIEFYLTAGCHQNYSCNSGKFTIPYKVVVIEAKKIGRMFIHSFQGFTCSDFQFCVI